MIRRLASALLALTFSLALAAPVGAYELWGYQLTEYAATHNNVCFGSGVEDSVRTAFYAGAHDWEEETPVNSTNRGDCTSAYTMRVTVHWNYDWTCDEDHPLGATVPDDIQADGDAQQMHVELNRACWTQGKLYASKDGPVPSDKWDVYSIGLHELGHVYGLDHDSQGSTMEPKLYTGVRLDVRADDIAGVDDVYGW